MPPDTGQALEDLRDGGWVAIARLDRTRGNRGELAAESLSSHEDRFTGLRGVTLFGAEGFPDGPQHRTVERVWKHGSRLIFKFEGVDTISDAEQLRGAEVRIPLSERPELPGGEYYHSDLVGCEVMEAGSGRSLGKVVAFVEEGGNGLLQVEKPGGPELLIPFAKAICLEIDIERRRIAVEMPEGLLELNQR